jgi:hypothetical protein
MKMLLGDFNAKVINEDIFKPTIGNESLQEISNDNGDRVVNFSTSKNLIVKSTKLKGKKPHDIDDDDDDDDDDDHDDDNY